MTSRGLTAAAAKSCASGFPPLLHRSPRSGASSLRVGMLTQTRKGSGRQPSHPERPTLRCPTSLARPDLRGSGCCFGAQALSPPPTPAPGEPA